MAAYTRLTKTEAQEIGRDYGLPRVTGVRAIREGSVNTHYLLETTRGRFVVKIEEVKSEIEVKREVDLLLFLHKHGVPCPVPLADQKGRYFREWNGRLLSVSRHIDGRLVPVEKMTTAQLENLGRVVAELHVVGKNYKKGVETRFGFERVTEIYADVRGRLPAHMKRVVRTLDEEHGYLAHYLENKLPKGIIHGDLFADNLLFRGDRVTAVLDFEAAGRGKFIFDLATAVNALCFLDGKYVLDRFEALMSGYESLRTLSLAEWDAFPNELRFSAFRFTVTRLRDFFLNPVDERVRINKDFQEFYDRLLILRREKEGGMEPMLMAMATGYDYRRYQKVHSGDRRNR